VTYNVSGGSFVPEWTKITGTDPVDIFDHKTRAGILSVIVTELAGATPSLTLEVFDGTTSYYLRYQKVMSAKETFVFNEPLGLDPDQRLRATISAGAVDVCVVYLNPDQT